MPSLSDFFDENTKKEFSSRNLKVGSVIKTYLTETTPPKEKRLVIVGFSEMGEELVFVIINSKVNQNIFSSQEQVDLHQKILKLENHSILEHDSFVDCSKLIERETSKLGYPRKG